MQNNLAIALQTLADDAQNRIDAIKAHKETFIALYKGAVEDFAKRLGIPLTPESIAHEMGCIEDAIDDLFYAEISRLSAIISNAPDSYDHEVSSFMTLRDYQ